MPDCLHKIRGGTRTSSAGFADERDDSLASSPPGRAIVRLINGSQFWIGVGPVVIDRGVVGE